MAPPVQLRGGMSHQRRGERIGEPAGVDADRGEELGQELRGARISLDHALDGADEGLDVGAAAHQPERGGLHHGQAADGVGSTGGREQGDDTAIGVPDKVGTRRQ